MLTTRDRLTVNGEAVRARVPVRLNLADSSAKTRAHGDAMSAANTVCVAVHRAC